MSVANVGDAISSGESGRAVCRSTGSPVCTISKMPSDMGESISGVLVFPQTPTEGTMRFAILAAALSVASPALAKGKGGGGGGASRAISELAGKFKWGMSHDDCEKII